MRRREVVAGLFASSLPMPLAAQGRTGRIGYLALLQNERLFNAMVRGLEDHGHVLNTNIVIEARSAEGDPARLDEAAAPKLRPKNEARGYAYEEAFGTRRAHFAARRVARRRPPRLDSARRCSPP